MLLADIEAHVRDADVGLTGASIGDLRARRGELDVQESQISYVRRTLQARIDLIDATLEARRDADGAGDRLDGLLAALPDLITPRRPSRSPRSPRHRPPVDPDGELLAEVESEQGVATFLIPEAGEDTLVAERERLAELERRVSDLRRRLHAALDAIQADIARRYRSGELTPC